MVNTDRLISNFSEGMGESTLSAHSGMTSSDECFVDLFVEGRKKKNTTQTHNLTFNG